MTIAKIKLDEKTTLSFGVNITGADGKPDTRFVIDGKDFSVSFPARATNEGVEVDVVGLKDIFKAGEYTARLEVVLENKIYTPLVDKIEFEPSVSIATNTKAPIKEAVKFAKVTVKQTVVNEDQLRKTQAATIIAQALDYHPTTDMTPTQIINHALSGSGPMTYEQIETVNSMLALAEEVGVSFNKDLVPVFNEVKVESVMPMVAVEPEDDGWSDEDLDELADSVDEWEDIASAYEPGEIHLVDDETGEEVDDFTEELSEDVLNEVLSRVERIRAKVRFHHSQAKRTRKLKIALRKHSSNGQINARARHMAIKTMKMKLAKKPLEQLSVSEKERIEKIVSQRKKVVDRLAMKMTQRVRKIEKDRLTHHSTQRA